MYAIGGQGGGRGNRNDRRTRSSSWSRRRRPNARNASHRSSRGRGSGNDDGIRRGPRLRLRLNTGSCRRSEGVRLSTYLGRGRRRLLLRTFHIPGVRAGVSRANGSSQINRRNCKCHDRDGNGFLQTHSDSSSPSKNSFQSLFGLADLGHRNALPPDASGCGVQRFEESQQGSGVIVAVGASRQGGFIAGLLCQVGEMTVEPPGERAEPEDGAMQQRQPQG